MRLHGFEPEVDVAQAWRPAGSRRTVRVPTTSADSADWRVLLERGPAGPAPGR